MKNHINLITDFGRTDQYAGVMSGVILGINPDAKIINTTHEIPPQSIATAAFVLLESLPYWSKESIHVVVVDPGVGSERFPVVFKVADQFVVGPDNGFISHVAASLGVQECRKIENHSWMLSRVSKTFHGRDIFAPVAAHLSLGMPFSKVGPKLESFHLFPLPPSVVTDSEISGSIIHIDHFGNAMSNISFAKAEKMIETGFVAKTGHAEVSRFVQNFSAVPLNETALMVSSGGWLEIIANKHSAAEKHGIKVDDAIRILPKK